ncbi:MAG: phosphatidate cytidylyltransferase, partial [Mesorhizobium sp.]
RDGDHSGLVAILFLFAVVWATDIAAYFVGRAVGGPKLAPSISPGKTQSGALGGAVGGVIAGLLLAAAAGAGNL